MKKDIVILILVGLLSIAGGMLWRGEQVFRQSTEILRLNNVITQTQHVLGQINLNKGLADAFSRIGYAVKIAEEAE